MRPATGRLLYFVRRARLVMPNHLFSRSTQPGTHSQLSVHSREPPYRRPFGLRGPTTAMSDDFQIWPQLAGGKTELLKWPLSLVLLMEDKNFPWIVLVRAETPQWRRLAYLDAPQLRRRWRLCGSPVSRRQRPSFDGSALATSK